MFLVSLAMALAVHAGAQPSEKERGLLAYFPAISQATAYQLDRFFDISRGRRLESESVVGAMTNPIPQPPLAKEYARTFRILLASRDRIDQYDALIVQQAQKYRLNPRLIKAIVAAESEFFAMARSPAGALGLMQVMPATAEELGVPRRFLFDPEANIRAGAAYMAYLFTILYKRHNLTGHFTYAPRWLISRVLAAYNGGLRYLREGPLCRETRQYLEKVLLFQTSEVSRLRLSRPS